MFNQILSLVAPKLKSPLRCSLISGVSGYVWQCQAKRNAGCRTNGQRNALEGPGPL